MSRSLWWRHGLTVACYGVRDTEYNSPRSCDMLARVLLKEVTITAITTATVWPQEKLQGGKTALPINRELD